MSEQPPFSPLVCVVDFHHARGPEIEQWFGLPENSTVPTDNDWSLLPFLALPDGSHAASEEFSYFTLRYRSLAASQDNESTENGDDAGLPTSLFGIACTRHVNADELTWRPLDVTRTSVQKAVVAIVDTPYLFSRIREKLSVVTNTWFAQRDFRDRAIVEQFRESIVQSHQDKDTDEYFGLALRELIYEYKHQTMVLFKCCLLQPKMLFFGSRCEKLCLLQFALISLIPGLLRKLQDCADPSFNTNEQRMVTPSSLRTSDRDSLLAYMGLPLQIFGKGSLFGPYTPLQQLDVLVDKKTVAFVAGSTNSLLVHQKNKYGDVFVNLDEHSIDIATPRLRYALSLSVADRRFIDILTQAVYDTWDPDHPTRPSTHGYAGSEDFIRLQFEEYLLALLSSIKYSNFVKTHKKDPKSLLTDAQGDPANEFCPTWVEDWQKTDNYRLFDKFTDSHLFDVVEPRHPCAGAMSLEDIQRRLGQQVADLHLDERLNTGREVIGKTATKMTSAFTQLWADMEAMRAAERTSSTDGNTDEGASRKDSVATQGIAPSVLLRAPDLSAAQANVQAAGARAGAFLSSWGAWASEKSKAGFARSRATSPAPQGEGSTVTTVHHVGDESQEVNDMTISGPAMEVAEKLP